MYQYQERKTIVLSAKVHKSNKNERFNLKVDDKWDIPWQSNKTQKADLNPGPISN